MGFDSHRTQSCDVEPDRSFSDHPLVPHGQLPDDLTLLAQQLNCDAKHLARCYPPHQAGETLEDAGTECIRRVRLPWLSSWRGMGSWRRVAVAIGVSAVVVWGARSGLRRPELPAGQLQVPQMVQVERPRLTPRKTHGRRPAVPRVVPEGLFEQLSGPEQEALLDLMEIQQIGYRRVSL